jgi:SAM-dependent methyltransferase
MVDSVEAFYDRLADDYHLLFEDWGLSVRRQAEVLDRLLCRGTGGERLDVLDCCCGIGTQAVGLALRGHRVHGTDLSRRAVERARQEAVKAGVSVAFAVADVRALAEAVPGDFDVVLACDNALPHLLTDEDLARAVAGVAAKLRPGGLFLASTRDYDEVTRQKTRATPVRVFDGADGRRVVFQVWDWSPDGRSYRLSQFLLRQTAGRWETLQNVTDYRALLRSELSDALRVAGLGDVRWYMPEECGYYQPVVTARKPGPRP